MFTIILISIIAAIFLLSIILERIRARKDRIDKEIEDAHLDVWMKEHLKNKTL